MLFENQELGMAVAVYLAINFIFLLDYSVTVGDGYRTNKLFKSILQPKELTLSDITKLLLLFPATILYVLCMVIGNFSIITFNTLSDSATSGIMSYKPFKDK